MGAPARALPVAASAITTSLAADRSIKGFADVHRRVELPELLFHGRERQGQIVSCANDVLLPLFAQDVAQELPHFWIDPRIGDLAFFIVDRVDDVHRTRQGVAAIHDAPFGKAYVGAGRRFGNRDRLYIGASIAECGVCDAVRVLAQFDDHPFAVGIFAQVFIPGVAAVKYLGLEQRDRTGAQQGRAIDMNGFVGPRALKAQLAPGADVLRTRPGGIHIPGQCFPSADPLGAENAVQLLDRELRNRVVLVHKDCVGRRLVRGFEAAGGHLDLDRIHP